MATYDNKHWLLTNIRNSFISTDDTGMCEIVMAGENFPKLFYSKAVEEKNRLRDVSPTKIKELGLTEVVQESFNKEIVSEYDPYPDMEESDDEDINHSDIRYDDFGPHRYFNYGRQRSNTAQWLDKKEQALKKAAKIKVVKWENPSRNLNEAEKAEFFTRKDLNKVQGEKCKSLLTDQLEKCPHLPHRQYLEYAKFDGTAQLGLPTKSFKIFMTMLSEKHQNYPVIVCIIASAKIQDLIGFTCYKYSIEHPDISLGSAHSYGLCIAEDDGEVDWAFPCLDAKEPCSKFGFTCLGLVDLKSKKLYTTDPDSLPDHGGIMDFPMIYPKPIGSGQIHPNTSRQNTGGSGTSEAVFYAIQSVNNDKKGGNRDHDADHCQTNILATDTPQHKSYRVQLLHRMRANTPVHFNITLDRIEVEPLISGSNKFWSRSKFILHSIDTVAWCQVMESKGNKTIFRLVYSRESSPSFSDRSIQDQSGFYLPNPAFKHHDFESDHETAREIVEKVNRILELRNSPCRREYKTAKEKKLQTRRSFQQNKSLNISCS